MALKKPSSYFGDDKKPEVNNSHQRESTPLSFAGTFDGILESVYLKIKDLTDEQIEFIKDDVFKIYSLVDNLVEHELPNYKKQSMGATIQLDKKISDVKESLAIQLQEHIAETRSTIQTSLLENGLKKYDKTISALSTDLKVVERFISENAKDIVSLKEEVTKELEKATVRIPLIEERLREIKQSYEGLTSKQLLTEGGLNEPPNVKNEDPLTPLDQNFVTFEQLQNHYQLFINRIQQQMATIGGGGETQLKYLDDIVGIATNASAYDGKYLKYNHTSKKFEFSDVGGGGSIGITTEIQTLNNVLGLGNTSDLGMSVGVSTFSNAVIVGGATTELVVNGDARITGILTIGAASVTIDGINNVVTASSYNGSGAALTGITTGQIVDFVGFATEGLVTELDIAVLDYVDNSAIPGLSTVYTTESYVDNALVGYATEGYVFAGDSVVVDYIDSEIAGLSTVYTTESYVDTVVAGIVSSAPTTLDTLNELAQALGDDPNFATTTTNLIGTKASLDGDTFTGVVTATAFSGDGANITGISTANITGFAGHATESYVDNAVSGLSTFSGDYNDLSNKPTIPSDTGDLTNNIGFVTSGIVVGYATEGYVDSAVSGSGISTDNVRTSTLNVSGVSTFSGDINLGDGDAINFGDDSDLTIQHNGGLATIENTSGSFYIRNNQSNSAYALHLQPKYLEEGIVLRYNGAAEVYYDNAKKFETTGYGVTVFGTTESQQLNVSGVSTFQNNIHLLDDDRLQIGGSVGTVDGLEIYHDGSHSYIDDSGTGNLYLRSGTLSIQNLAGSKTSALFNSGSGQELYYDNSKKFETTGYGVTVFGTTESQQLSVTGVSTFTSDVSFGSTATFGDNDKLIFGDDNDLEIFHNSSNGNTIIQETTGGNLVVKGSNLFLQSASGEDFFKGDADGAVELYYDDTKKFETTAGGVSIDGGIQESFTTLTSSTGTVTHDCSAAQLFYHTSPSANFTVNLTNLALSQEYATTVTIVINQGDPAYMVNGLQIGGSAQTIKWQGNNSAPNGTASGIDVVTFSILNDGGTYVVLAQSVPFGGV